MASVKPHVVYEPIDNRTLSKKEKIRYLVTAMGKPRLDRRPSISDDESDYEVDSQGETPLPEVPIVITSKTDHRQSQSRSMIVDEKRQHQNTRKRLDAELRKLDDFWSFKPIPRDTSLVRKVQARAALNSPSCPNASEVHLPSPLPHSEAPPSQYGFPEEDTNTFKGWSESSNPAELVELGSVSLMPAKRIRRAPRSAVLRAISSSR